MTELATRPSSWHKDLPHYALWFSIWGALFSFLQPVSTEQLAGSAFWGVKVQQALLGIGFGIICAVVFAVLQNTVNRSRIKWRSWLLAIGAWVAINIGSAFALGRLG